MLRLSTIIQRVLSVLENLGVCVGGGGATHIKIIKEYQNRTSRVLIEQKIWEEHSMSITNLIPQPMLVSNTSHKHT